MDSRILPARLRTIAAIGVLTACGVTLAQQDWHVRAAQPDPAYSQVPFWFWNDALEEEEIKRQMADFREHGVFGFVIHPRMGIPADIPYMSERWLHLVRTAVEEAARTGMRVCLYDEAMYPSGSAHGEVVRTNPDFAAKGLKVAYKDVSGPTETDMPEAEGLLIARVMAGLIGENKLDGSSIRAMEAQATRTQVPAGRWRLMTFSCVPSGGCIRGIHEGEESGQPRAPKAGNLLDPAAMQCFIRLTHDRYYAALREHFGKTIFAIFTDEPSMLGRAPRSDLKPWTPGLEQFFEEHRGYALVPMLPALFFDMGAKTRTVQEDFSATLIELLNETYYRPLSEWCAGHAIALTGHPSQSDDIALLRFFQIPGQDVVWRRLVPDSPAAMDGPDSTMAKCTSSIARQDGRRFNTNECFGAYGWDLTMDETKWLADWLMVRGVNMLMPHAFYYSIRGNRVNERPPDVGPNNAWWPHYRLFADYTTRVCGLMSGGKPICDVAILVPRNSPPWRAAKYLLEHQVDFDYLEDWRVTGKTRIQAGGIRIGEMTYRTVILDQASPLAANVQAGLNAFEQGGGIVVRWRGDSPPALPPQVMRGIRTSDTVPGLRCLSTRKDGIEYHFLVNEGEELLDTTITVGTKGKTEWFDPWTGHFSAAFAQDGGNEGNKLPLRLTRRQSKVLCVDPGQPPILSAMQPKKRELVRKLVIEEPWTAFDPNGNQVTDRLGNWLKIPGLAAWAGTLRYRTTFQTDLSTDCTYELNLGHVGDWAVVQVNGQSFSPRLWSPFSWDIRRAIRSGTNELTVEVTNSLANRMTPDKRRPSGLMGPVVIREYRLPR